jgi:hypothetical protein
MGLSGSLAECNIHTAGHCLDILSSLLKTGKGYRMLKKKEKEGPKFAHEYEEEGTT